MFFRHRILCFGTGPYIFHPVHAMTVIRSTVGGQTKRQFGTRLKEHQKAVSLSKKGNSALSEHTCQTNHTIAWDNSKIITTNRRYHQRCCLKAWHINSAHAPLNRDDASCQMLTCISLIDYVTTQSRA